MKLIYQAIKQHFIVETVKSIVETIIFTARRHVGRGICRNRVSVGLSQISVLLKLLNVG